MPGFCLDCIIDFTSGVCMGCPSRDEKNTRDRCFFSLSSIIFYSIVDLTLGWVYMGCHYWLLLFDNLLLLEKC